MRKPDLRGIGVLVTRPAAQAGPLCGLIEAAGGRAVRLPALAIAGARDQARLAAVLDRLGEFDMAVFVSPNAVTWAAGPIEARGGLPPGLKLATVGRGSARALAKVLGREPDICPAGRFDSEALLALEPMREVADRRIIIFRGEGGREVLAETLRGRGARVEYAEVYRRVRPDCDPAPVLAAWERGKVDIVTVTSNEALANLEQMLGDAGRRLLLETPLVVVSERGVRLAQSMGFKHRPLLAGAASDEAILAAVAQWAAGRMEKSDE